MLEEDATPETQRRPLPQVRAAAMRALAAPVMDRTGASTCRYLFRSRSLQQIPDGPDILHTLFEQLTQLIPPFPWQLVSRLTSPSLTLH